MEDETDEHKKMWDQNSLKSNEESALWNIDLPGAISRLFHIFNLNSLLSLAQIEKVFKEWRVVRA